MQLETWKSTERFPHSYKLHSNCMLTLEYCWRKVRYRPQILSYLCGVRKLDLFENLYNLGNKFKLLCSQLLQRTTKLNPLKFEFRNMVTEIWWVSCHYLVSLPHKLSIVVGLHDTLDYSFKGHWVLFKGFYDKYLCFVWKLPFISPLICPAEEKKSWKRPINHMLVILVAPFFEVSGDELETSSVERMGQVELICFKFPN